MYWRQGCYTQISFHWQEIGNTAARTITCLCLNALKAKDLKKLGTLEIRIIRKKMKISVPYFLRKFEIRGEKNYFHDDTILAAAFP